MDLSESSVMDRDQVQKYLGLKSGHELSNGQSCYLGFVLHPVSFFSFLKESHKQIQGAEKQSRPQLSLQECLARLLAQPLAINTNKLLRNIWATFVRNPAWSWHFTFKPKVILDLLRCPEETEGFQSPPRPPRPCLCSLLRSSKSIAANRGSDGLLEKTLSWLQTAPFLMDSQDRGVGT